MSFINLIFLTVKFLSKFISSPLPLFSHDCIKSTHSVTLAQPATVFIHPDTLGGHSASAEIASRSLGDLRVGAANRRARSRRQQLLHGRLHAAQMAGHSDCDGGHRASEFRHGHRYVCVHRSLIFMLHSVLGTSDTRATHQLHVVHFRN